MKTVMRNNNLFCLNCGMEKVIVYPISIDDLTAAMDKFNAAHKDCLQTWQEPQADMSADIQKRALWWLANGETGLSSETMWHCFMGTEKYKINHPSDPGDFKRCYKLLQVVPEWRALLDKLKPLSDAWKNLVENWDKLTEMFEENERTKWKEHKRIGMYEFMQSLIGR